MEDALPLALDHVAKCIAEGPAASATSGFSAANTVPPQALAGSAPTIPTYEVRVCPVPPRCVWD